MHNALTHQGALPHIVAMDQPAASAWIHDRVVKAVAAREMQHAVYTNLGAHHNACLTVRQQELYPDLVLCDRETFRVEHVMEVETPDTLTDLQAKKWALLARGPWHFWLIVPAEGLSTTEHLCRRFGVHVHLATWSGDPDNVVVRWPVHAPARRASRTL